MIQFIKEEVFMRKGVYITGVITPVLYIFTVILGGMLWPEYSHKTQAISELSMASSPNLALMDSLFTIYGILLFVFSLGYTILWSRRKNASLTAAGIALIICALAGLLMKFFRQDPIGTPATFTGIMHLVLAGMTSLGTIFAIFLGAAGFGKQAKLTGLKGFSIVMGILVVLTGGLTAAGPTLFPSIFGFLERLTIGSFMIWLLVTSISLLKNDLDAS